LFVPVSEDHKDKNEHVVESCPTLSVALSNTPAIQTGLDKSDAAGSSTQKVKSKRKKSVDKDDTEVSDTFVPILEQSEQTKVKVVQTAASNI